MKKCSDLKFKRKKNRNLIDKYLNKYEIEKRLYWKI